MYMLKIIGWVILTIAIGAAIPILAFFLAILGLCYVASELINIEKESNDDN